MNRTVAVRCLENAGSEVVVAEDGVQALERWASERFDFLLLDLDMPQRDGYEVVREIRERERGTKAHLPIVAITAHSSDDDRRRCLGSGMDGFLVKPFDEAALLDELRSLALPERVTEAPVASVSTGVPAPPVRSAVVFDRERALARANGDPGLVSELCELFLEETPATLDGIAQALADGDRVTVERKAHRLKGALLTLAANRSAQAALDLETVAKTGDLAGCRPVFSRLQEEIRELQAILCTQVDVKMS